MFARRFVSNIIAKQTAFNFARRRGRKREKTSFILGRNPVIGSNHYIGPNIFVFDEYIGEDLRIDSIRTQEFVNKAMIFRHGNPARGRDAFG
ncbi:hypothetical protein C7C56_011100 [Massilia glaciei]|uniref:Uncharacterized protein n=1 Tax=Massilia glaciei TaxID=1524097 RepID=A0A2U2HM30_9BURK|nr:hypothetical protein C7C56_011100 [Massilia glaciei]